MKKRGSALAKIKYTVSDELGMIVGNKPIARTEVIKKLWAYIKKHKLQGKTDKRQINPDFLLANVTGSSSFDMMKLAGKISSHLTKV